MEFNFFRKIRFIEQGLRNPNSTRVADPDDPRLGGHCDYIVTTSAGLDKGVRTVPELRRAPGPAPTAGCSSEFTYSLAVMDGWQTVRNAVAGGGASF